MKLGRRTESIIHDIIPRNIRQVKYFRYSTFGELTAYVGRLGQGSTVDAVIQCVKEAKAGKSVISNTVLNAVPNTQPFDLMQSLDYTDKTVWIDTAEMFLDVRPAKRAAQVIPRNIHYARKMHNRYVISIHDLRFLDSSISDWITTVIGCRFIRPRTLLLIKYRIERGVRSVKWRPVSFVVYPSVKRYFKYYNAFAQIKELNAPQN